MEVQVLHTQAGGKPQNIALNEAIYAKPFNEGLVHQAVVTYLSGLRQGSKAQLTRAEVRGGGRKPWRQKGTGRARAGSIRSPLWTGGGRTFAAKPRSFTQKINKKMYKAALQCILAELLRQDRLVVVDKLEMQQPKTKDFLVLLNHLSLPSKSVIFIIDDENVNFYLSARNLPEVEVIGVEFVDPVSLIRYEKVVFTAKALEMFEQTITPHEHVRQASNTAAASKAGDDK